MAAEATGAGLVDHWSWASKKGLMNSNTAGALRAACSQVLAVEDDWESLDVRAMDVDLMLQRFENLRMKDFTPKSLAQYGSRFRRAVKSYLEYLEHPHGWRFDSREPRAGGKEDAGSKPRRRSLSKKEEPIQAEALGDMITYPFPVRSGVVARLVLPRDLRATEARRLSAFLQSLAIDEPKELPSGGS